jgi:hypothetical protein
VSRLDDRLDDLLSGRGGPVPEELAPLLRVAERLQDELAPMRLDPGLAHDHLRLALGRTPGRRATPPGRAFGWRRRVATALVAAMVATVPAVAASASSVPGDLLWPVKQAVEGVKLVAARSAEQLAATRVALAQERLDELERLLQDGRGDQVAGAAQRLREAIDQAAAALLVARDEGVDSTRLAALESRLRVIVDLATDLADSAPPTAAGQAGPTTGGATEAAVDQVAALQPLTSLPGTVGAPPPTGGAQAPPAPATTVPPATPLLPALPPLPGLSSTTTTTTAPPADDAKDKKAKRKKKKKEKQVTEVVIESLLGL